MARIRKLKAAGEPPAQKGSPEQCLAMMRAAHQDMGEALSKIPPAVALNQGVQVAAEMFGFFLQAIHREFNRGQVLLQARSGKDTNLEMMVGGMHHLTRNVPSVGFILDGIMARSAMVADLAGKEQDATEAEAEAEEEEPEEEFDSEENDEGEVEGDKGEG